jgi:hypothetical protein
MEAQSPQRGHEDAIALELKTMLASAPSPLTLRVPAASSVAELKARVSSEHPLRPPISAQRLIFAGRLLGDEERLDNVLPSHHVSLPAPTLPLPLTFETHFLSFIYLIVCIYSYLMSSTIGA